MERVTARFAGFPGRYRRASPPRPTLRVFREYWASRDFLSPVRHADTSGAAARSCAGCSNGGPRMSNSVVLPNIRCTVIVQLRFQHAWRASRRVRQDARRGDRSTWPPRGIGQQGFAGLGQIGQAAVPFAPTSISEASVVCGNARPFTCMYAHASGACGGTAQADIAMPASALLVQSDARDSAWDSQNQNR